MARYYGNWETTFDYRAHLRDGSCFEFRVIAIDVEGNQSEGALVEQGRLRLPDDTFVYDPLVLDGSSCGPVLEAPRNLKVSTGSVDFNGCTEVLEWDTVPGAAR